MTDAISTLEKTARDLRTLSQAFRLTGNWPVADTIASHAFAIEDALTSLPLISPLREPQEDEHLLGVNLSRALNPKEPKA